MSLTTKLFIPKLYCSVIGHQYKVTRKVTRHINEFQCACCRKEITNNPNGKFVELTPELKFIHLGLEQVLMRRRTKKRSNLKVVA